jgi:tRNA threonylcarbamoyladenosine biosynthesis protein TsaE
MADSPINATYTTHSAEETIACGAQVGKILRMGDVVCLEAEMGMGKTTMIQGIAQGLGMSRRMLSPTFVIMREYPFHEGYLYHIDAYRLNTLAQAQSCGIGEVCGRNDTIVLIEWPDMLRPFIPTRGRRIEISLRSQEENTRIIQIRTGEKL